MKLTKIIIEQYKSIQSPVEISFSEDSPTVLIGKNGSGKTNALEALAAIAEANSDRGRYAPPREPHPGYRAFVRLSPEDVAMLFPAQALSEEELEIEAFPMEGGLQIAGISGKIVPKLRGEIGDLRDLVPQLDEAFEKYRKQVEKLTCGDVAESPLCCYSILKGEGGVTNFSWLELESKGLIENVTADLRKMQKLLGEEKEILIFDVGAMRYSTFLAKELPPFRLEYRELSLPQFEGKFVTVNKRAIKREIARINRETESALTEINRLDVEIRGRLERLQNGLNAGEAWESVSFLRQVREVVGRSCQFLKNESQSLIFKKEEGAYLRPNTAQILIGAYLQKYGGEADADGKLTQGKAAELERLLNESIPDFDRGMYEKVKVRGENHGIFLVEKTGEEIDLNETSAGRRWYFTYYFMKSILEEGDTFLIDEPAAMLHPCAQREVFQDLKKLSESGIRVIYTTHSPYLIPEGDCGVHFVTMTEKGTVIHSASALDQMAQLREIVGEDIFDVQTVLEPYFFDSPENIARNISELLRKTQKERGIKSLEEVCDRIGIKYDTMKSWNYPAKTKEGKKHPKFCSPSPENVVKVLKWAKN